MGDTRWNYKADCLEFCNCAYGCSCNFNGCRVWVSSN